MTEQKFKKYFSLKLFNLLDEYEMTQHELAKRIKVTDGCVSEYITLKRFPKLRVLIKISEVFNITVSELLDFSEFIKKENKENEVS